MLSLHDALPIYLATRILELDRGGLIDWNGDYASFLVHKEAALAAEETANALFDKRLAQEEVWIRQGIKARRSEEHTTELQSLMRISYAVFCLQKTIQQGDYYN